MAREQITLQCTECKRKNYTTMKNKKTMTERLEIKKFCPFCRKPSRTQRDQVNLAPGDGRFLIQLVYRLDFARKCRSLFVCMRIGA